MAKGMDKMKMTDSVMRIYLTNLAAYNAGHLKGNWVNLPCDDIQAEIDKVLAMYPKSEELFITDYESECGITCGEYENIYKLNELCEEAEDILNDVGEDVFQAAVYALDTVKEAINCLRKGDYTYFAGIESDDDLGQAAVDEGLFGELPDEHPLSGYIDYEAIGRDMRLSGYVIHSETSIAICCG